MTKTIIVDGMMRGARWYHADGTPKRGKDLEAEKIKIDMQNLTKRLIAYAKERGLD
jgi:hypothetical protein